MTLEWLGDNATPMK